MAQRTTSQDNGFLNQLNFCLSSKFASSHKKILSGHDIISHTSLCQHTDRFRQRSACLYVAHVGMQLMYVPHYCSVSSGTANTTSLLMIASAIVTTQACTTSLHRMCVYVCWTTVYMHCLTTYRRADYRLPDYRVHALPEGFGQLLAGASRRKHLCSQPAQAACMRSEGIEGRGEAPDEPPAQLCLENQLFFACPFRLGCLRQLPVVQRAA